MSRFLGDEELETVLCAGSISVDPVTRNVTKDGQKLSLVPREYALLEFLMRHPNQVFSANALLDYVWPSNSDSTSEACRTAMKRLRRKIDPENILIRTVHSVGYVLEKR